MNLYRHLGWMAAGLTTAAAIHAQPAPAASTADPLQADAAVPPMVYSSAFVRYRGARDVEVGSWREVNDTVARIGGWRAYAREAQQPDAATVPMATPGAASPLATPGAASPSTASGHGKH